MSEEKNHNFEDALVRLETIVKQLEDDSVSLEESIALYEEGIALSKVCTQTLEEAELRIKNVATQQADNQE